MLSPYQDKPGRQGIYVRDKDGKWFYTANPTNYEKENYIRFSIPPQNTNECSREVADTDYFVQKSQVR